MHNGQVFLKKICFFIFVYFYPSLFLQHFHEEKRLVLIFYTFLFVLAFYYKKNIQKYFACIFGLYNKFTKFIRTWPKLKGMLGWYIQIFKIIKPSAFKNKMFVTQTHNEPYSWTIKKKHGSRIFKKKYQNFQLKASK